MKITIKNLKRIIREALSEIENVNEVDTDPSNNPGRPADPFDYIGMHPKATAAMAHPAAGGGGGDASAASTEPTE